MEEEFDLLAGHDLGESNAITHNVSDPELANILVWHKLESAGYHPPAREGHSAVTNGFSVFIFGGFQAGKRTNSVLSLNVITGSWSVVNCYGSIPSARCYHAACAKDNYMFIHGGESQFEPGETATIVKKPVEDNSAVISAQNASGTEAKQTLKIGSIAESVWNSTIEEEPVGEPLEGVCPGDTIGYQRNLPNLIQGVDINVPPTSETIPRMCCVDDFYILDTITREWNKISCILAPLPRKGHSMVIANIDSKPHVVIFGGYSSDNLTLSNSIHVCEVSKLIQYYKNCQQQAASQTSKSLNSVNKIKSLRLQETTNNPVVFRTLNCKGTVPAPRYRHSCTIVDGGNDGVQYMVIVGGIGKDASTSLCDVHVLNLQTLQWLSIDSDGLTQGHAGEGPSTGIYGHAAFAIPNSLPSLPVVSADGIDNAIPAELLVYGGSSNATSAKSNCHRHVYGLDLMTYNWRRIRTGFAFPSARNNHSATLVPGWAPTNSLPAGVGGRTLEKTGSIASSAIVIFGGVNSVMCASDTWALDLKWRPPGVDAYDGNVNEQVDDEIGMQVSQRPATMIEKQFLRTSGINTAIDIGGDTIVNAENNRSSIQAANDEKYATMIKSVNSISRNKIPTGLTSKTNRTTSKNQYDPSEYPELKMSASLPQFNDTPDASEFPKSFRQTSKMTGSRSYDFLGTANEQLNRELLQSTMMLATSETTGTEDQQVGHAFLKVRKERAQADILLKQETTRAIVAENANVQLAAEFEAYRVKSNEEKDVLLADIEELKLQLERSYAREKQLQILNEEAYDLLVLSGIKQL